MNKNKCFLMMPKEMASEYKFSKYNIYLDESKGLVYNAVTQAVSTFENHTMDIDDISELVDCGFVVPVDMDELEEIKNEYDGRKKLSNELHLIIATTLDCQFSCCYCYESHPKVYMNADVKKNIIDLVKDHAATGKNISVVWYGGEPLLDFESVCMLSKSFIDVCRTYGVNYHASMLSNGYLFSPESINELDELQIKSVQITLDGMKDVHEQRRPLMDGSSSFDRIIRNMKNIKEKTDVEVHLRINVDKSNIESAYELIRYCSSVGLDNIDVNLGMLKAFGCDHVCGARSSNLFTMKEFSLEFLKFRDYIEELGFEKAVKKMVPEYKINSCTMDAPNAYVIDPHGWVYKCISQIGKKESAIGNVSMVFNENAHTIYSPFLSKRCTLCNFFPVCKGGCLLNNSGSSVECNIWKYITGELVMREISGCI
ncbi:radical SAM protein [Ruminococcus sp. AM30-15AC]|jgi:uncharacterized protein|nr:radical SAM protein [Ruminococcus sp. TM10-9AT]RHD88456.1 radical SAM protein [Ruminococcus sp. AM30-15AC]RHO80426.1 radical SAM protein [Ruminococcus sp. AF42-9BH]RHQ89439.1 radical SAM protein [Ruminococcus sp. AF21-3]RHT46568.1 radical SAM protein [Ruminococcus sp. AM29-26]